jgi:hypothetical protein
MSRLMLAQQASAHINALCAHCTGHLTIGLRCQALDCPVLCERTETEIEEAVAVELCNALKLL